MCTLGGETGARQRNLPTGASAYLMPRKYTRPLVSFLKPVNEPSSAQGYKGAQQ